MLLPVVLMISLIAVVAFTLNHQSVLDSGISVGHAEAERAEQVAQAGLQHATWGAQNSGCAGDMAMTTVPFGQAGTGSYTATITTPGGTTTGYPDLAADQDSWFRSDDITNNNGGSASAHHLRMESGNLEYAVVRFDLSSLPAGAQINSAVARFYVDVGKGHPEGPVTVHRATADWTEASATWETMGDKFDSAVLDTIPAQPDAGDTWVTVNLTAQVQAWVNGGEPNYGIMLIATGEGTHAEYISREGAASQQPRLDVIVGTGPATPATISATGTLAGNPSPAQDITRSLTRTAVPAYQPPGNVTLQLGTDPGEDTLLDSFYGLRNYGGADYMQVHDNGSDWQQYPLIRFDLARLPRGAFVRSARLELSLMSVDAPGTATIHQVTRSWVEGTKSGGGTADGATWFTHDGTNPWTSAGGDINAPVVAETAINGGETWVSWEIGQLVEQWLAGAPNNGLLIKPDGALREARFAARENTNFAVQPKLTITYACECGSACLAPQGFGNVLMVVGDDINLAPEDAYKQALLEAWGYAVVLRNDNAGQTSFDNDVANSDVVYISETIDSTALGTKVSNAPIGIVNEDGWMNDELGLESGNSSNWPVGDSISITDNTHYITAPFASGSLTIYDADMGGLAVDNTPAPGLQSLADWGSDTGLAVLDTGAMTAGGAPTAGRRVMLPLGRNASFNWDYLNGNGRLIVQRALQWGTGNTGAPPKNLLLVVGDPGSLTAQEAAKKTLIESWGYSVNLIDESDSQANFDAAIAANDVAYIPQDINSTNLGTKLANATIGVVNEEGEQVDELGIAQDKLFKSRHEIDIVDSTHYITSPFATGLLTFVSSDQSVHMLSGTQAPGLSTLAQSFNSGSQWKPSLAVIETGGDIYGGGTAAERRVQLPWGGGTFDINQLTDDGRTIMQRAIEWAAGAGSTPASGYNVLLVVGDATTLASKDVGYKALMESWGHTVTLIDDGDSQANYDAAAAANDVVYVSGSSSGPSIADKLTNTTTGLVNEVNGKLDNFGFSSSTSATADFVTFSTTNAAHYITESFSGNPVTVFTSSLTNPVPGGTLAPDLQNVGEVSSSPALVTLEAGATGWSGSPVAARRAHLPFTAAETTDMTVDGQTILQRTLEWAAGADIATTYTVLMVVSDPASLTPAAADRKALMESWGYTVNLIDDDDSAVNFDAAINAADVVYVGSGSTPTTNVTKMLTDTTKGVVSEPVAMASIAGFASSWMPAFAVDQLTIIDSTHSITQGLASPVTVFTSPLVPAALSGTLSPDLQNLAEFLGAPALAVLESGATTHDAQTTAGRRANLPFASAGAGELAADGQLLVRRAIEWAASGSGGGGGGSPPAGPVFEEFAEVNPSTTYNVNVPTPGGTVAGDLLIAAIASDEDASDLTAPAGWNTIAVVNNGTRVTLGVWWKIASASEPSAHQFSSSSYNMKYGWMMRFSGHDPASPINATSTFDTGSSKDPPVASATTTVNNTLVLRVGGFDHEDITLDDPGLAGHTPITMDLGGSGLGACAGGAGYTSLPTAGATGTSSFALTAREQYVTGTIAIAPAP